MADKPNIIDITVPDIGDVENVEIIEILVSEGDQLATDDSILTLESDKASMEIPAAHAGIVKSISVTVGASINVGDVIGTMQIENSASDAPADTSSESEATASAKSVETAAVATQPSAPAPFTPAVNVDTAAKQSTNSPTAHLETGKQSLPHASPGVRRYAREHGANLHLITGSGRKGRIARTDVTLFIKGAMEGSQSSYSGSGQSHSGIPAIPEVDFSKFGETERVELGRINKLSASNLHRAWLNVPMVTHHDSADITEMEAFRKQLKTETVEGDAKITGLAFHMKALAATLKVFPKVNSSLAPDGQSLIYKKYFHIGIAVDTPNGLVVPVFRDVDQKSIQQLATEMADISTRARAKKLKPDEMQGASITISSLGGIGGTAFTPIVNPPEVAILGITRAKMAPVWNGTEFLPRLLCPLDLSYDHRVVDGADAARFMAHYCKTIGDIRRLLL
ncbi:MAG: dihydrolipoyllysine-residue acetyltransferase [Granulosicoccaceae bacterium]